MGKVADFYGVSKIEVGAPGDGIMGTVFDEYTDITEGTVEVSVAQGTVTKVFTETNRQTPYRSFNEGGEGTKFTFGLLGVPLADLPAFIGGAYDIPTLTWTQSKTVQDIYKSVRITQRDTETGKRLTHNIPYGFVTATIQGSLTFNNVANLLVTVEAQTPISAVLVEGDPYFIVQDED